MLEKKTTKGYNSFRLTSKKFQFCYFVSKSKRVRRNHGDLHQNCSDRTNNIDHKRVLYIVLKLISNRGSKLRSEKTNKKTLRYIYPFSE